MVTQKHSMNDIFSHIYEIGYWGVGSGHGSALENTVEYNAFVRKFLEEHSEITSVLDLGCGDWQSSFDIYDNLSRPVEYLGIDVVLSVVHANRQKFPGYRFECRDVMNVDALPYADVYILKDVLQHWSNDCIISFMDALTTRGGKCKYMILCNCCFQQKPMEDCKTGEWRPLFSKFEPLARYHPVPMLYFSTKEVCVITIGSGNGNAES